MKLPTEMKRYTKSWFDPQCYSEDPNKAWTTGSHVELQTFKGMSKKYKVFIENKKWFYTKDEGKQITELA
jgi:hypothetical protein